MTTQSNYFGTSISLALPVLMVICAGARGDGPSDTRASILYMDGHTEEITNLSWHWEMGASDQKPKEFAVYTPQKRVTYELFIAQKNGNMNQKSKYTFDEISKIALDFDFDDDRGGFHQNIQIELRSGEILKGKSIEPDYPSVIGKAFTFQQTLILRGKLADNQDKNIGLAYPRGFMYYFGEFEKKYNPNYLLRGGALKAKRRQYAKQHEAEIIQEIVFSSPRR